MQVSPDNTQRRSSAVAATSSSSSIPTSFLLRHHPQPGPGIHRAGDGEHGRGVVRGGGGRRRGVSEGGRAGLLWTQLILRLVQEHGVLDLDGDERRERVVEERKGEGWNNGGFMWIARQEWTAMTKDVVRREVRIDGGLDPQRGKKKAMGENRERRHGEMQEVNKKK